MITDKSKYGHDAVFDLNCNDSVQVLRTEPMTLTEQEQKIVQKYLGIALLEKSYIDANGHLMVVLSDGRTLDVGSARGLSGATPYLGENGNWFVEGVDTLQSARGLPGFTPYIGENEHWWIDETDTGVPARGIPLTEKADNTRFLRNDGTWQKVTPENIGAAQAGVVADHESRIEALEQRTVTAPYYTDDSVAYIKEVPENALPFASVDMIGGTTRKCTNLINLPNTETDVVGVHVKIVGGVVTVSGTATASGGRLSTLGVVTLRAGTYVSRGNGFGYFSRTTDNMIVGQTNGIPFTLEEETTLKFGLTFTAGTTYSETFSVTLNAGGTALPYEPYFDGLRSAPVTEVESVGKCLFPASAVYGFGTVVSKDWRNCYKYTSGDDYRFIPIKFKENTQYTVKVDYCGVRKADDLPFSDTVICFWYTDGTYAPRYVASNGVWATYTVVSGENKTVSAIGINSHEYRIDNYIDIDSFRVVEGAEIEDDCPPYKRNTLTIPAEVQAMDGYGCGINADCYNYIDWENKRFVKRVERVDLGTLGWYAHNTVTSLFEATLPKKTSAHDSNISAIALLDKYEKEIWQTVELRDKQFALLNDFVRIYDVAYTDATTFKAAMSGVMLYYELAEPVITDISDLLPDDNLIGVEGSGTVTMVNEYGYDAPSEITYARLTWQ